MIVRRMFLPASLLLVEVVNLPEIEPRKQRNEEVELVVDLLATQEDHKEVRRASYFEFS